nr:expansin EXLX1 family cellulose-binding protein [Streptomyces caniscabiei]
MPPRRRRPRTAGLRPDRRPRGRPGAHHLDAGEPGPRRTRLRYKEGSTQWWCGIQVRNHRNPVATLEVRTGTTWRQLPRQEYNYFVSADGAGCGSDIRVKDIHGQTLTDTGIALTPNVDQPGRAQFTKR